MKYYFFGIGTIQLLIKLLKFEKHKNNGFSNNKTLFRISDV